MKNLEQNPPYIRYPGCEAAAINQEIMAQLGSGSYAKWISVIRKEFAIGYDQITQTLEAIDTFGLVDDKYFPDELWKPYTRLKDLPKEVAERAFDCTIEYEQIQYNQLPNFLQFSHVIAVIPVFDSFRNVGADGLVKMGEYKNPSRHAMMIVNRQITPNPIRYDFVNSYGYSFGKNGHVFFPTGYIAKFRDQELFYTFNIEKI